jgi:hypothetical protein
MYHCGHGGVNLNQTPAIASLVAKSSHLPRQPLTSHPSVKEQLDKGSVRVHFSRWPMSQSNFFLLDFDYREDSVVISGNLITRYLVVPLSPDTALIPATP